MKAIQKYRNHPSSIAIRNECKKKDSFKFIEFDQKKIEKDILKLDASKTSQSSDIPVKVIKNTPLFLVIFSEIDVTSIKLKLLTFSEILKHADVTPL